MKHWGFTAIFLVIGLGLIGGGIYSFLSTRAFLRQAVPAEGAVIDLTAAWDSEDGSYTYYPRVRFRTPDGRAVEFTSDVGSSPPAFEVGEPVRVLFDPANPARARIDSFVQLWLLPLILGGIGLVFGFFGAAATFGAGRRGGGIAAPPPMQDEQEAEPTGAASRPYDIRAARSRLGPGVVERDRRD
jgi:hypothetical protein